MSLALAQFTEKLVPISDFSQGKAGKIFKDVADNDSEYIVLKNNQPMAVVVSMRSYKDMQERLARMEAYLDMFEDLRLLKMAESRVNSETIPFEDVIKEEGFDIKELEELAEKVEFE